MAFVLDDRVRETSTAPGIGSFTMNGAVQGAQTFASALTSNGDTTWYEADNGTAWETGLLTRTSATVYARTTIFRSTNSNTAVNFATGTVSVSCDLSASKAKVLERLLWAAAAITPPTNDGTALGTGALAFSDLFLAAGGVLNFNNGDYTVTHSAGALVFSGTFGAGTTTITSNSASALVVGPNGATNPTLKVDASAASAVNGLKVRSTASGGGVAFELMSSATNEPFYMDAKGSGTFNLAFGSTGNVLVGRTSVFSVNVQILGSLSKGSGTFLIDHPLDPKNKDLYHGFVEAPRYDLIYRGKVKLVKGKATVEIDAASNMTAGTFAALTQNAEVVALNNLSGFDRVKSSAVVDGSFQIISENNASSDTIHWVVIAERHDPFIINNEGAHTDDHGRMVPEQMKPANGEGITETEHPEIAKIIKAGKVVDHATIGKRGFPRHWKELGLVPPARDLTAEEIEARKAGASLGEDL
jgi:hypothetical protein